VDAGCTPYGPKTLPTPAQNWTAGSFGGQQRGVCETLLVDDVGHRGELLKMIMMA
jgi:hypothetical protein